jgi:hypothetical protein
MVAWTRFSASWASVTASFKDVSSTVASTSPFFTACPGVTFTDATLPLCSKPSEIAGTANASSPSATTEVLATTARVGNGVGVDRS